MQWYEYKLQKTRLSINLSLLSELSDSFQVTDLHLSIAEAVTIGLHNRSLKAKT